VTVSTGLTRARRSQAALALNPIPASKVQSNPFQIAEFDKHNSALQHATEHRSSGRRDYFASPIMVEVFESAFSRRNSFVTRLLIKVACILFAIAMVVSSVADAKDVLTVKTETGKVHGKAINEGKVHAWLAMALAGPPVGDLRCKTPRPVAKWSGVREANEYAVNANSAPQYFQVPR
jgi:hypothetical protein